MNAITTTGTSNKFAAALSQFIAEPASPRPLAALRIGVSTVLLVQAFAIANHLHDLYGPTGVVQWAVSSGISTPGVPHVGWFSDLAARLGLNYEYGIRACFALYVSGLAALLIGYRARAAAIVAWLTHLAMNNSAGASIYGVDSFAQIALFYCAWMPVGYALSVDKLTGRVSGDPSALARLSIRVLQFHLCIAYLACGIEKALGPDWWSGEAIWCALSRRDLCPFDMSWMADHPWIPMLAGWGTLVVEAGYPVFVWPRRTRRLWASATIGLHVGIAVFMGLVSFSALMSVLTFSAFVVSAEKAPARQVVTRLAGNRTPALSMG